MIESLARASVEGAVMVGGIYILSRALPLLSPAVKAALWWCAAAKVLVTVLWSTPLIVPILPAVVAEQQVVRYADGAAIASAPTSATLAVIPAAPPRPQGVNWTSVATALWIAGVGLAAARACRQWWRIRASIARSMPPDRAVTAIAREIATRLSIERLPAIRMSNDIESPLVTRLLRPVVLLPATRFPLMDIEQQRMTICHELAHMKRGDVWFGCVPALAERIFFFHPLVRFAVREYVFWREAACDAAVLRALGTAPQAYGRLLLDLGVTRPQSALAAAGAAWSFSNLKRRIIMLQHPSTPRPAARIIGAGIIAIAVLAVMPLRLGAREVVLPPMPPAPIAPVSPAGIDAPAGGSVADVSAARDETQERRRSQRDEIRYVYMSDRTTMMSGSSEDVTRARRQRNGDERTFWFIRDGKEYVVTDPTALNEIARVWDRVSRLGAEQGAVGAKQGEIGAAQARIGARQGRIGAEQGVIGARQAEIAAREVELAMRELRQRSNTDRREVEGARREVERKMRELDREMEILDSRMRDEEQPMSKLAAEMEALGAEMSALGRHMEGASREAEARMRTLIERAIANGSARQVK